MSGGQAKVRHAGEASAHTEGHGAASGEGAEQDGSGPSGVVLSTLTTPGAHVWGPQREGWRGDEVGTRGRARGLSEGRCGQGKR